MGGINTWRWVVSWVVGYREGVFVGLVALVNGGSDGITLQDFNCAHPIGKSEKITVMWSR